MHKIVQNLLTIKNEIKLNLKHESSDKLPKIIAVSKTFNMERILPLIDFGHSDFGENKVQEANEKWSDIKSKNPNIKLHMLGKLQTNKVKLALRIFDYIHSVDSVKLANKISEEQKKNNKKLKLFIQINIGDEKQKSGVDKDNLINFYNYCKKLNLDVIGLMCIPPVGNDPVKYFKIMCDLRNLINLEELSMGMSSDYIKATKNSSTYLRIGTGIFGKRI